MTDSYDVGVWFEDRPITAAEARRTFEALAGGHHPSADPAAVAGFIEQLADCFPDVERDALPPAPASHNLHAVAVGLEVYVFEAGAYLSFSSDVAPDLIPLINHLADQHGVVVYDRQRQAVHLPKSLEIRWTNRFTAGDGFVVAHDVAPEDIPVLMDAADQSSWFRIFERPGGGHFMQTAPAGPPGPDRRWFIEHRDGSVDRHYQVGGVLLDDVKRALMSYAANDDEWRTMFDWVRIEW